jgi:hypothetical protein
MKWEIGDTVRRPPNASASWAEEQLAELRACTTGPIRVRLINGAAPAPTTTTGTLDSHGELRQDQAQPLPLEDVVVVKVLDGADLPRKHDRPPPEP